MITFRKWLANVHCNNDNTLYGKLSFSIMMSCHLFVVSTRQFEDGKKLYLLQFSNKLQAINCLVIVHDRVNNEQLVIKIYYFFAWFSFLSRGKAWKHFRQKGIKMSMKNWDFFWENNLKILFMENLCDLEVKWSMKIRRKIKKK